MNDNRDFTFDHVAISVPDIAAAEAFYVDALGMTVVQRKTWEAGDARMDAILALKDSAGLKLLLSDGHFFLEIWQFTSPLEQPQDRDAPVSRCGITHFGLRVTDIFALCQRLAAAGMSFHTPPTLGAATGNWATYGRDPFGNVIELVQPAGPAA